MKAITVWQPWAEDIIAGRKLVENRTWTTDYRGPLIIHTGRRYMPGGAAAGLPRGVVLGVVQLDDVHLAGACSCRPVHGAARIDTYALPNAPSAPVHHLLISAPRRVRALIPAPGRQMLWTPPDALVAQVRAQLVPLVPRDTLL